MAESTHWAFPAELQPRAADVAFDLKSALDAVVMLRATVPDDAFTASILGTERSGNGIVIREDGLTLTIGYLVTEAETVWLTTNSGTTVEGHPLAYDFTTGFGLVLPLGKLNAPMLKRGTLRDVDVDDEVFVIGHGGRSHALKAQVIAKREFAGYWEYLLDDALFTAPPHPEWSGAALVDESGLLQGVGSLLVQEEISETTIQGNMFVPAQLLDPLLDDLLKQGRSSLPAHPWMGLYSMETGDQIVVSGLATRGPAETAGVRLGDVVVDVGGSRVTGLGDFYRKVWSLGPPGTKIPLTLARDSEVARVELRSGDRSDFLKKPSLQ